MRRVIAGLLLLSAAVSAAPQRSPDPEAQAPTLRGRVVSADNDAVLRRARVAIAMGAHRIEPVLTDDDGRFSIRLPSAAAATLTATKAGFAAMTLRLPATALGREVSLRLARGAAISGRIVDAAGTPAADVPVAVRHLGGAGGGPQHIVTTDDLGEYRIGGLASGRYLLLTGSLPSGVMIGGVSSSASVIVQAASPPLPISRALLESDQSIEVAAGQEVTALDLRLPAQPTPAEQRAEMLARGVRSTLPCPGTASVRVRVTTDNGEPLAGASVWLSMKGSIVSRSIQRTGAGGMTVFDCLAPSDALVEVSKRGYVVDRYGDRRAVRMSLSVRDGPMTDAPAVVMRRAAAVLGSVTDEHGEPMEGVTLRALAVMYARGRTSAASVAVGGQTDDRGRFRISGLQPGVYLLAGSIDAVPSASGRDGSAYVPTYFPGTPDIGSASELRIAAEDVTGVDLVVRPSVAARVSGVAMDSEGNPVRGRIQLLVSQRSGGVARDPIEVPVGPSGEFALSNVPPGDYVLHAIRPAGLGLRTEIGAAYVSVTRDSPLPVTIRTSEGSTIAGRLVIEDSDRRPASGLLLSAFAVDFDRAPLTADGRGIVLWGDGTFYFSGIHGATRIAMTGGPEEWYLKAVRVSGADVTDRAFELAGRDVDDVEIVISTAGASLTGRSADPGRVDDYAVAVFPVDANLRVAHSRYMKLSLSSADGAFRVSGLPPGEYWAAALDARDSIIQGDAWQEPAFLDRLSSQASRVTLGEGERRAVTLRLTAR
jgi:hypothetical protein